MTRTSFPSPERQVDPTDDAASRALAGLTSELESGRFYRVVAVPASHSLDGPSVVAQTIAGDIRLAVRGLTDDLPTTRAGIGLAQPPSRLRYSADSALLALRLTSRYEPTIRADDLGVTLLIAEAADAAPSDQTDLAALKFLLRAHPHALPVLELLSATANVKSVSAETGLHVETVRDRSREFARALGFDVLSSRGRARLRVALALFRLQTNRFA